MLHIDKTKRYITIKVNEQLKTTEQKTWRIRPTDTGILCGYPNNKMTLQALEEDRTDTLFFMEESKMPFITDSQTKRFKANGKINLIGEDPAIVKDYILKHNLNKNFSCFDLITFQVRGRQEGNTIQLFN